MALFLVLVQLIVLPLYNIKLDKNSDSNGWKKKKKEEASLLIYLF